MISKYELIMRIINMEDNYDVLEDRVCELEMKIMWCNAEDISDKFDRMVACIYNNVYKKVSGKP